MNLLDDFHLTHAIDKLIEHFQSEYPDIFEEGFARKTGAVMADQQKRQQQAQVGQSMQASLKAGQQLSQKQPGADPAAQQAGQQQAGQQQKGYDPKLDKVMPWLLKYSMQDKLHRDHVIQILKDALQKAAA